MDGLKLQEWTLSLSTPVVSTAAISYLPYFIYHPKRIWVGFDMRITIEKTAALRYLGPYPLMGKGQLRRSVNLYVKRTGKNLLPSTQQLNEVGGVGHRQFSAVSFRYPFLTQ